MPDFREVYVLCKSAMFDFRVNWVVIHGVKYQKQAAVVYKHFLHFFFTVFLRIQDIFVMPNGEMFFVFTQMHKIQEGRHLHS